MSAPKARLFHSEWNYAYRSLIGLLSLREGSIRLETPAAQDSRYRVWPLIQRRRRTKLNLRPRDWLISLSFESAGLTHMRRQALDILVRSQRCIDLWSELIVLMNRSGKLLHLVRLVIVPFQPLQLLDLGHTQRHGDAAADFRSWALSFCRVVSAMRQGTMAAERMLF